MIAPEGEIAAALQDIFRDVLRDPGFVPMPEMETGAHPGWDSIANVEILIRCEERWDFEFGTSEIDVIRSFGDLTRAVAARAG